MLILNIREMSDIPYIHGDQPYNIVTDWPVKGVYVIEYVDGTDIETKDEQLVQESKERIIRFIDSYKLDYPQARYAYHGRGFGIADPWFKKIRRRIIEKNK